MIYSALWLPSSGQKGVRHETTVLGQPAQSGLSDLQVTAVERVFGVVQAAARSSVPALGYAGTYTFANVLMTFAGTFLMMR